VASHDQQTVLPVEPVLPDKVTTYRKHLIIILSVARTSLAKRQITIAGQSCAFGTLVEIPFGLDLGAISSRSFTTQNQTQTDQWDMHFALDPLDLDHLAISCLQFASSAIPRKRARPMNLHETSPTFARNKGPGVAG